MNLVTNLKSRLSRALRILAYAGFGCLASVSEAALLNLSDSPLYLITSVEPNVLLTFDDSGSMAWAHIPDSLDDAGNPNDIGTTGLRDQPRGCASNINRIYYDRNVTYEPPVKEDGTPLNTTPTSFTAAYRNGFNTGAGTVNLSTGYRPSWLGLTSYSTCFAACTNTSSVANCNSTIANVAAFYFVYDTTLGTCAPVSQNTDGCYRKVVVSTTSGPGSTDERQNFANWYSYYRNRNMTAKTAAGRAFSRFGTNVRVAGTHLNATGTTTGPNTTMFNATVPIMKQFSGANRTDFFTRLYNSPTNDGTPLRQAMRRAGEHFGSANTGANSPYRDVPGNASSPERTCRQNFQIMMSDGYWNQTAVPFVTTNADGTGTTLGDGTGYTVPKPPYSDSTSATLADGSFSYWSRDLRTDAGMTNNVPTRYSVRSGSASDDYWNPVNDPANWQRLVNFTIGLGIDGTLPFTPATYSNLLSGTQAWPAAAADSATAVDDLWHAAINSRGRYFSAGNPTALVSAFTAIISDVADRISSASSAALNTSSLSSNSFVYQARFNSGDWSGQLLAYPVDPATGNLGASPAWDAGVQLNSQHYDSGRTIITYKPSIADGIPFRWPSNPAAPTASELDVSQSAALNYDPILAAADSKGQARLDYLRGDASKEGAVGFDFRVRSRTCGASPCPAGTNSGVLGDTINSAPLYVGRPATNYPDNLESQPYSTFKNTLASRTPMLYLGANDGMLHGFDANTGLEKIAYVPSKVYRNLSQLSANPYPHRYFVDGSPVANDVFINGAWRSVLVGGLRKGGQGVYALDVTDPGTFAENNAANIVLWEFNDTNDADLGYIFGDPVIAKMQNGKWAAIFGNGYNNSESDGAASTTGRGVLYILFIEGGADGTWNAGDVVKIDTGVGSAATPNGLSAPTVVDVNGDLLADYIYAGDLQGNMWRFDVTGSTPANWTNSTNWNTIFVARDSASNRQPITSRPEVGFHPAGYAGLMVYFGTGKYLEISDASVAGATTQTFYGVWDESGIANPVRSNLLQQTVDSTHTIGGFEYRVTSNNTMIWRVGTPIPNPSYVGWYLDLPTTGERTFTNSLLRDGRIIFTTVIPSSDPCSSGGDGWLMELSASNGGRLDISPFDVNGDGTFDSSDLIPIGGGANPPGYAAGGQKFGGIPSSPTVMVGGDPGSSPACVGAKCGEQKIISSSDGTMKSVAESLNQCNNCRSSWRQLR